LAIPIDELEAAARARGEATMRDQCDHLPPDVRCERVVREGSAADHIVEAARERGADLIVLGTHGRGRLARFILGSTAEEVVRRAHCPVMTIGHDPSERHATAAAASATGVR
jgi:nucleotide-binding universal stress UspA family protein